MIIILTFVVGTLGGFLAHVLTMKINFKQRTIDNKIKVYDSIITQWVTTRNFIYSSLLKGQNPTLSKELDEIYGISQQYLGEAILVSENDDLTEKINELNEKFYRTDWGALYSSSSPDIGNEKMEAIKTQAMLLIKMMRQDIKASTRLDGADFTHIFHGFWGKKRNKD